MKRASNEKKSENIGAGKRNFIPGGSKATGIVGTRQNKGGQKSSLRKSGRQGQKKMALLKEPEARIPVRIKEKRTRPSVRGKVEGMDRKRSRGHESGKVRTINRDFSRRKRMGPETTGDRSSERDLEVLQGDLPLGRWKESGEVEGGKKMEKIRHGRNSQTGCSGGMTHALWDWDRT